MAAALRLSTNRTQLTGLTSNSAWHDIDLTSYVNPNSSGVFILIKNTGSSLYNGGVRLNGSSQNAYVDVPANSYTILAAKLDGDDIIEYYAENAALEFYLLGDTDENSVTFLAAESVKEAVSQSTWNDIDCTTDFGGDAGNVDAVILLYKAGGNAKSIGYRENGSTDNRPFGVPSNFGGMIIVGVDSSDIFEAYTGKANSEHTYVLGYIKSGSGVTINQNEVDESQTTTGSWTDLDLTSDTASSAKFAIIRMKNNSLNTDYMGYIRDNGSSDEETPSDLDLSFTNQGGGGVQFSFPVLMTSGQVIEYYIESTDIDFWLTGYGEGATEQTVTAKANIQKNTSRTVSAKASIAKWITLSIAGSADDAWQPEGGALDYTSNDLRAGNHGSGGIVDNTGLRFQNVTIPKDSIILEAYLGNLNKNWYSYTGASICKRNIKPELSANPGDFTGTDIDSRTRGSGYSPWAINATDWGNLSEPFDWNSGDNLCAVVQEILDRTSFDSGNSMVIFIDDNGTDGSEYAMFTIDSYDQSPSDAAQLRILYQPLGDNTSIQRVTAKANIFVPPTIEAKAFIRSRWNPDPAFVYNTSYYFNLTSSSYKIGTKFRYNGQSNPISKIGLYTYSGALGTSPYYRIGIQSLTDGEPSGTWLGATNSGYVDSQLNNSSAWQEFTLNEEVTLTNGQEYAVVIEYQSGTIDSSNYRRVIYYALAGAEFTDDRPYFENYDQLNKDYWQPNWGVYTDYGSGWSIGASRTPCFYTVTSESEYWGPANPRYWNYAVYGNYRAGLKFVAEEGMYVDQIGSFIYKYGSPADDLYYEILDVDNNDAVIASGTFITTAQINAYPPEWKYKDLASTLTLQKGKTYAVVFNSPSCDSSNWYGIKNQNDLLALGTITRYKNGNFYYSDDGGSTHNDITTRFAPVRVRYIDTFASQSVTAKAYIQPAGYIQRRIGYSPDDAFDYENVAYSSAYYTSNNTRQGHRDPDGTYGDCTAGYRFRNIDIPDGAAIMSAYFKGTCYFDEAYTVDLTIQGVDTDNEDDFTTDAPRDKTPLTSALASWTSPTCSVGDLQTSPDLVWIINEIIGRSGWASGNAIALIFQNDGETGDNNRNFRTWDYGNLNDALADSPYLVLELGTKTTQTVSAKALIESAGPTGKTIQAKGRIQKSSTYTITVKGRISVGREETISAKGRIQKQPSRTISAKGRIQKTSTQTITALASIKRTFEQSVSALGRINVLFEQTIESKASISKTPTRTVSALGRIQKQANQTISALGRIGIQATKTIQAVGRIQIESSQNISAKAAIQKSFEYTISALGRITIFSSQTVESLADIKKQITRTVTTKGRIGIGGGKNISAKGDIKKNTERSISAKAAIKRNFEKTIEAKARINIISSQTIEAKANLKVNQTKTINANGRITIPSEKTIQSLGRIQKQFSKNISALGRITIISTQTVNAKAVILKNFAKTISAKGAISRALAKLIQAKGRIQITSERSLISKGSIKLEQQQTVSSKGRITRIFSQSIEALGRITALANQTLNVKGRIEAQSSQTVSAKGNIEITYEFSVDAKARIEIETNQNISAKANIVGIQTQTISAKASIRQAVTIRTIDSKGRIQISSEQYIDAKANIKLEQTQTISAKGSIFKTNSQTIQVGADLQVNIQQTIQASARIVRLKTETISAKAAIATYDVVEIIDRVRDQDLVEDLTYVKNKVEAITSNNVEVVNVVSERIKVKNIPNDNVKVINIIDPSRIQKTKWFTAKARISN